MVTFDNLPDGANLIEQTVAIEGLDQKPLRARIVQAGERLRLMVGSVLYDFTDRFGDKPVTEYVTSVSYEKDRDQIRVASEKKLPGALSGTAYLARRAYEEILKKLGLSMPPHAQEGMSVELDFLSMKRSPQTVVLSLEQQRDGIQVASL